MQINNYTVRNILALFNEDTVYIDKNIQRKRGNWSLAYLRDCLRSFNLGRVSAPIVVADNNACLKWIKADALRAMDAYSCEYYQARIASGYDYTILDGQHKLFDVLHGFINGDWTYSGYLTDANGVTNPEPYDNVFFKDLPQRTKDAINDATVYVAMHADLTAIELSEVFITLQQGLPLNDQQKRRPLRTKLTGWVRDLAETQENALAHILSPKAMAGSGDEEFTVKLLMATVRKWRGTLATNTNINFDLKSSQLNLVYREGVGIAPIFGDESPYDEEEFERFEKIFNHFGYIVSQLRNNNTRLNKQETWMLFWAIEYAHDNSLQIQSATTLFEQVRNTMTRLLSQSHLDYSNDIVNAQATGTPEPSERKYYHKACYLPHESSQRNRAKNMFLAEFSLPKVFKLASLTRGYAAAK